jgi:Tfp pilus assembly protein PilN
MVGIARRSTVDRYAQIFTEAGVPMSNLTFTAAALHAAIKLNAAARDAGFVALGQTAPGVVEVYGESPARAIFSAEFEMQPERAAALALSELRLPPGAVPLKLEAALPECICPPGPSPADDGLSRNALAYATALAGACPRLAPAANLLPPEYRKYSSRAAFVPTVALAALLAAAVGGATAWPRMTERQYLAQVRAEIAGLQPQQQRAAALQRNAERARARTQWLDQYRAQTRQDLDLLNDLTKMIEPPAWTGNIAITPDSVRLQGEAPQAAILWKVLDSSGLFKSSRLDSNQPAAGGGESFNISATREAGK